MNRKLNRKKRAAKKTAAITANAAYDADQRTAAQRRFLTAQQQGASTREAARIAGVCRGTIYRWRNEDPEFAQAWRESRDNTMEDLEIQAYKRAIDGNDRLLMFLLKSHMPLTYNKRQQPVTPDSANSRVINFSELAERYRQCQ